MPSCDKQKVDTAITFGTFDLFHYGHLRILQRAKSLCKKLVVGVSSDSFTLQKKGEIPAIPEQHRMEIVASIKGVDSVFLEESFEKKETYIREHGASLCVMGSDWFGKFDDIAKRCGAKAVYLPRTEHVSTTSIKAQLQEQQGAGRKG